MADVDVKGLRAIVRVADAGSISQAAISLGLTQSFLSRIVSGVEREVGAALFHRTGRGIALTELGVEVVSRARQVVAGCDELVAEARERGREPAGLVTVALMPTLTPAVAEPLFDRLRREHPGIRLRMLEGFSANIAAWLGEGRADIGLLSRYGRSASRGDEVLSTSDLMLVGRPRDMPQGKSVRFSEVGKGPLVLPALPNGTRIAIDRAAHKGGVRLEVVVEADSLEAQKALVLRQGCRTVSDPRTFSKEIAAGELRALAITHPRIERRVVISTTPHHPLGRAARVAVTTIRRLFDAW